jgi:hypothetical protein
VKLPAFRVAVLIATGEGRVCEPRRGRPMRQWVPLDPAGEGECLAYLREARAYLANPVDPSPALDTALAYHLAWTGHDFERAMTYVAEDIVCDALACRFEGTDAFRGFFGPFVEILRGSRLIAAYGDATKAMLMYDTQTVPVRSAPVAECLTVRDGRITHIRIVFDRAPFDAARRAAASV